MRISLQRSFGVITIAEKSIENYIEWCSQNTKRMNVGSRYQHRIFQDTSLQTQTQTQACGVAVMVVVAVAAVVVAVVAAVAVVTAAAPLTTRPCRRHHRHARHHQPPSPHACVCVYVCRGVS